MAKYSKRAGEKVEKSMHEKKEGKLKSGGSGKKVTNPKQAIAIGLSEARQEGAKVPKKKAASKKSAASSTKKTPRSSSKKSASKARSSSKK
ncbi:MAG: DUF6496 domain-containing protein [Chitinophagales bacterium]